MNHFQGTTARERYDNDLLNEIRRTNELLEKLIGHNGQMTDQLIMKNKPGRRKVGE